MNATQVEVSWMFGAVVAAFILIVLLGEITIDVAKHLYNKWKKNTNI